MVTVNYMTFKTMWKTHWAGILSCWHTKCQIPVGPVAAAPLLPQQQFLQRLGHLEENITLFGSLFELQSNILVW